MSLDVLLGVEASGVNPIFGRNMNWCKRTTDRISTRVIVGFEVCRALIKI